MGLAHQDGLFAGVQGPIRRTEVATSPVSPEGVAGGVHVSDRPSSRPQIIAIGVINQLSYLGGSHCIDILIIEIYTIV